MAGGIEGWVRKITGGGEAVGMAEGDLIELVDGAGSDDGRGDVGIGSARDLEGALRERFSERGKKKAV